MLTWWGDFKNVQEVLIAESGILIGYFTQNIPSYDFGFEFKSNWHGFNIMVIFLAQTKTGQNIAARWAIL